MITRKPFSIDFILSPKTTKVKNNKKTTDEDDVIPPAASRAEEGGQNDDDRVTWTDPCQSPQNAGLRLSPTFHSLFDISRMPAISGSGVRNSSLHPQPLENLCPVRGSVDRFSGISTRTAFRGFAVTSSNDAMTSSDLMNPVSAFHATAALLGQREMMRIQMQQASRYPLLSTVFYPKVIQYNGKHRLPLSTHLGQMTVDFATISTYCEWFCSARMCLVSRKEKGN